MTFMQNFSSNEELIAKWGIGNAYLSWVMALYLDRDDIDDLATNSLTDGGNDKKIDFIDLDISNGRITFAQGTYSNKGKDSADSNKASDLNTAFAWLWSGDLSTVPEVLRSIIEDCRQAIKEDQISSIAMLYVHNLPESLNVLRELQTVKALAHEVANANGIAIITSELGIANVEKLYVSKHSHILIQDKIEVPFPMQFQENGPNWSSYVFTSNGRWLYDLYNTYSDSLFSANYRGFLGINKRKKINNGIRITAESTPENFWAYNNGITILTNDVYERGSDKIDISGISIINGAQTTGSLGSIDSTKGSQLENVKVLCRIIRCSDPGLIRSIVKANNTQNTITSWDMFSNDAEQNRIKTEFSSFGHNYSFKRGFDESTSILSTYSVAQPTLAFEGNFSEANRGKNNIFESNNLYRSVFQTKKARHLLLAFSISKTIDEIKFKLKCKYNSNSLISSEQIKYNLLSNLKFKMLFISLIGKSLEVILGRQVDVTTAAFTTDCSTAKLPDLVSACTPVVETVFDALVPLLEKHGFNHVLLGHDVYSALSLELAAFIGIAKRMSGSSSMFSEFAKIIANS